MKTCGMNRRKQNKKSRAIHGVRTAPRCGFPFTKLARSGAERFIRGRNRHGAERSVFFFLPKCHGAERSINPQADFVTERSGFFFKCDGAERGGLTVQRFFLRSGGDSSVGQTAINRDFSDGAPSWENRRNRRNRTVNRRI